MPLPFPRTVARSTLPPPVAEVPELRRGAERRKSVCVALRWCGWWVLLGGLLWSVDVGADCGRSDKPWVSVAFQGAGLADLETRVVEDFRAGLAARDIDVCLAGEGPPRAAIAAVRIAQPAANRVGVSVEVRDSLTEKRLTRNVDLSAVPRDGRAFAVALAVDELLRASWVELAIQRARRPARRAPPEVARVVQSTISVPREHPFHVGVRAAAEHYAGGQTHLGADAALTLALAPRWQLELLVGAREALVVTAPDGRVLASAAGAAAQMGYLLVDTQRVEVAVLGGARATWVRFRGDADAGRAEAELSGLCAYARTGLGAAARIAGPLWLELGVSAGAPLRALAATDRGAVVSAVSGLELGAQAGMRVEF